MAKILLGIALAVMLATAALGFLAKGNADKLQTTLKDTNQKLTTVQSSLSIAKSNEKKAQEELAAANAKVEDQVKEIATQKGQMDDINTKLKTAATDLEAKIAEVTALQKMVDDMKIAMGKPGPGGEANPALEALKADVAKAQTEVAESKALIDSLTNKKQEVERQMASLEQYKKSREMNIMRQGTSGRILAVNGGWNFVVLSIGDKQGAVMNGTMLVVRGGEPIGKVRISSVEAGTSIADILPGSVRKGVTVQPGDNVVFEGNRGGNAAPAASAGVAPGLPTR